MLTAHTQSDHHRRHHPACPPTDRPLPLSFSNHTSSITTSPQQQHYLADLDDAAYLSSFDPNPNDKLLRNYFLTTSNLNAFNNSHLSTQPLLDVDPVAAAAPLMTSAYDFQGPAIRIQQSTPVPQIPLSYDQHSSMLATAHSAGTRSWDLYGGGSLAAANNNNIHHHNNNTSLHAPYPKRSQPHQRAQSTSSLASSGSSQYPGHTTATAAYSYSGLPDNSPPASSVKVESSYSADQAVPFSNHLPTPSQTPTSDSFLSPVAFQTFGQQGSNYDNTMAAHFAMKHAMMDTEEDVPGYTHSSRQSVSSYGNNSPATPRTVAGDDFDDKYKSNGEKFFSDKIESWMEEYLRFDDAPDHLMHDMKMDGSTPDSFPAYYNQQPIVPRLQTQASSQHGKNSLLSPYRSVMAERLQAAQIARSQSPISAASRAVSPFRHGSPLAPTNNSFGSPRQRFGVPQMREQTSDAAVKAFALKNHSAQNSGPEPKTISPKDALLEYNESEDDAKMPLFPADDQQFSTANAYESLPQNFDAASEQSFVSMAEPRAFGQSYATAGVPSQATFNFAPPSIPGSLSVSTGLSFASQPQYRPAAMSIQQESTPEFPAHLTSMDSSASEAGGPQESNGHSSTTSLQKPGPSAANTGTYSCTYHGCPLRFESPQKLQKHKREGHRQNPTTTVASGIGSGMSADELLARNSQAGPHKCERINPTTGKPCNTIFSRPYDLTRHEDTIHNARKQKVRCALCVEEKTFSRNDALTRHMRVVHPEVDFPGKHRRRGHGSHE